MVGQTGGDGELNNVRVAQHFQPRLGKMAAQGGDSRQSQDKIANGSAADDQNFAPEFIHHLEPGHAQDRYE